MVRKPKFLKFKFVPKNGKKNELIVLYFLSLKEVMREIHRDSPEITDLLGNTADKSTINTKLFFSPIKGGWGVVRV